MLADPQVEAVIIAIADQFHVPAAVKASRPASTSWSRNRWARPSSRAASCAIGRPTAGLVVQVGNNRRFDPGIAFARRFIREEMGQRIALKAWYYDSVYRYTMTDNLQPIPVASAKALRPGGRSQGGPAGAITS